MKIEEILDYKLKKLLGDEDKFKSITPDDKKFILAQAKTKIMAYCHRKDIPEGCFYIWADIAIEMLKNLIPTLFQTEIDEDDIAGAVTSVKAGDTTITLGGMVDNDIDTGYKSNADDDAIINSFAKQLQAFRKLPCGCGDGFCGD